MNTTNTLAALFGVAVGDALGVPVEFQTREELQANPVTTMQGYGTYNQSPGTWSDDSSMTFCLAESLTQGYDVDHIAQQFIRWTSENYWTAHNELFDIGIATHTALYRYRNGTPAQLSGGTTADSNGNGSLMRILPLLFYIKDMPVQERFEHTRDVSSITHAHPRSVVACFYYLEYARHLLNGLDKRQAYHQLQQDIPSQLKQFGISDYEINHFSRLLQADISTLPEEEINSSGYVLHSLEATIWCLLTSDSYAEATLRAVNLGRDTDTTGAITGGLAAIAYGYDAIPQEWIIALARHKDIEQLAERLAKI